ncbi:ABC transporter ATP-binding protein [Falsochrobactrum sp. TDYN1]|uniref:Spermidine/putrescine import ATP-binding protein PotA n=1 Tax=Falsochrobactrum tianjinense TaxID=2706015 RepID=A0A949PNC1_9HYPH|nr:ABC transporter ATP-binding protein [Falsochrobactrum sp. TDYN1]MBV2143500.1 ABC transporter ATP-binding protein [Falsochrobactrum sp. TDYN1]
MTTANIVDFVNVKKTYDGRNIIINDLNLSVRRGEFLTLLGGSGSGKTTTLMMLAGFEAPTQGHIYVEGKSIEHLPPHRRGIGVVFQNYALFPHMTIAQNLAYPLRMRKMSRKEIDHKVSRAMEMVRLETMQDRRPNELSGGQQQRVALARALVFEPELVLMDEPLGALDKTLREHMQYEIKQIHRDLGVTMVYVTHDQSEALTMSDRIAIFESGNIVQIDSPRVLYENPADIFVAGFIGENNILSGRAAGRDGDGCLTVKLDGGCSVLIRESTIIAENAAVEIAVRPEKIAVGETANQQRNQCTATIADVTYVGDHLRLLVDIGNGQTVILRKPLAAFSGPPTLGQQLLIGWSDTDGHVFITA